MEGRSTSYSFSAVSTTVSHPSFGQKVVNGEGLASIAVAYADDNTVQDQGADGSTMTSKVLSRRGTIALEVQQTSSINKWLLNLWNSLYNGDTSIWNGITIQSIERFDNGIHVSATGCAIQKHPDRKDETNGGHVTWIFMSDSITES